MDREIKCQMYKQHSCFNKKMAHEPEMVISS